MTSSTSPFSANLNSTINVLTSALRDLGHDLPDDLTAELDAIDAATQIPNDLIPDSEQAARRWYDLHREGQDPSKDKSVAALLSRNRDTTYGLEIGLKKIKEEAKYDAVTDAADGIIDTLRNDVAEAQEVIDEARRHIGGVTTETRVSGLSPDGHREHARAREAFVRADLARRAWTVLAQHTRAATWRPGHIEELLNVCDLTLDELHALNETVNLARTRGGIGPRVDRHDARTIVAHGHRLALATFAEYNERKARLTKEAEHQRAAAQEAFRRDIASGGAMAVPIHGPGGR
ncbi:hypothetical protein ACIA03_06095 [Nocardioides sp. NPDC051685]|uniref:hypothetical protein n=1 Tax=Nocardioides sp. NPDC051685 TaxID=3364334 RepID=UPI00378C54F6